MNTLLRVLLKIPILGNKIRSSDGYLLGQIQALFSMEDYLQCFQLAYQRLYENKTSSIEQDSHSYPDFVKYAVRSAAKLKDQSIYDEVKNIILSIGVKYYEREISESIIELSLLGYFFQDKDGMFNLAELASEIDKSWGEPYFLLGWYKLPNREAIPYFNDAISKDPLYRKRILEDSVCNKYPKIIAEIDKK
ncbi:MAG: hypothetical protein KZQ96_01930 [Candidatus Thiodiazotropha sp. (ex Lucinoma borealis)]|nr:hypothetical protein [Candidatus Thiodiazotropha sp. (ex Lucinoma borealis)]MCU7857895.1 hypothetical protein [Candidatus Thiodiazotropha sp. (ex Lucinoma borealis)]MCU7870968.1 hypothetical protein [Candidatus Thiodiazotropha sp. (ex Lucinoma borealis)]